MPVQQTILQVFVASPSDVPEERNLLEAVIDELNRVWADSLGVSYRLYKWELNVKPGIGEEPQAVINAQIPADYDLFIGIFWTKLGSPTKSFQSGTIEELERAISRRKTTGSPEVMIYFKDAPVHPSKLDPSQLQKLNEFRDTLSSKGALYSIFEDQDGFEASLRSHLSAFARNFGSTQAINSPSSDDKDHQPENHGDLIDSELDDLGYLDYIDIYVVQMQKMTNCLDRVQKLTNDIGNKFTKRTEQSSEAEGNPDRARKIMLMAADDMNQYSKELNGELDIYRASRTKSFDALSKSVSLHNEIIGKDETLIQLQQTLIELLLTISNSRTQIEGMRDAAAEIPRMIKEINQAKRLIVEKLDRFLAELDNTLTTASNIVDSIDQMV